MKSNFDHKSVKCARCGKTRKARSGYLHPSVCQKCVYRSRKKLHYTMTIDTDNELLLLAIHGAIVEFKAGCVTSGNAAYRRWLEEHSRVHE